MSWTTKPMVSGNLYPWPQALSILLIEKGGEEVDPFYNHNSKR